jgi:MFS transporter, DHA2 family, lincomycin resistance protein
VNIENNAGTITKQQTKTKSITKQQYKTGPIMAALLVAGFVGLFSETALNIALGDLSQIFNVNATTIQWLATGYFLTLGILVPVTGILMQKFTTRLMFMTSIFLSIIGTIIAAVAPVFSILLMGRIIQAAGLAIALPLTQNVIFTIFPPNKRGAAMGVMGLVMLAGPALGPTLAGLILDTLSWNWIFWVTLPFLLFSFIFGLVYLPNVNEIRKVSIDVLSVILSTIGFGGIVYGVSVGGEHGWTNTTVMASIIIGFVALIIFVIRQTKMENPMLNLKAFNYPLFVLGVFMSFITFFNMLSMLVILPMYMQMALLIAAFTTGLILLPGSLLNCILAPTIGLLFDKYGPKAVITPGTILVAIGYGLFSQFGTDTALWMIVVTFIVMMLGIGAVLASVQTNTLNSLPRQYYPDGIAITQTIQQVAGAVGIAVMVSILSAKQNSYLGAIANEPTQAAAAGSSLVFKISLLLAVINVVLSLFIKSPSPNTISLKTKSSMKTTDPLH